MAKQLQTQYERPYADQGRIPSMIPRLIQSPLLVQDEERNLARRARDGDEAAKQRLIEANMRLVCNIARNYRAMAVPFEDLVQEGAIGLMKAVERFDPEKGCRFSTYAIHWIRQSIGKAMVSRSRVIRIPAHVVDDRKRVARYREAFEGQHGRPPHLEEIALALGFSQAKMGILLDVEHDCYSLDTGRDDQWDYTTLIPDLNCDDPQAEAFKKVDRERFQQLIAKLPERERTVISKRLGLAGDPAILLLELAQSLKVSREAVRQIEARAVRSLRRMVQELEMDSVTADAI
ncbi:MAG: sigma-70 family RNA polymerase sigma factor [Armatimonadota bacterium]|nr:sigma-70 family RNA polymerase sigma factor [Armatimonadota bacterium]